METGRDRRGTWGGTVDASVTAVPVAASTMQLIDTGDPADREDPVLVFVHGNPTSSYLWRHVVARLAGTFRCVGVDLIGMGGSGKPDVPYVWSDHRTYLTGALDAIDTDGRPLVLVLHDWGVALGLEYARTHPTRVHGVGLMEGHLRPMESWEAFDPGGRELFRELRDPIAGRQRIEQENFFLDTVLPSGMHRVLGAAEVAAYREPFPTPRSRHPLWVWVTQIPIAGEPLEVADVLDANLGWLRATTVPRLLIHADPGAVLGLDQVRSIALQCPGLDISHVGSGLHFLPEDQPDAIAAALSAWADHWSPRPAA